MKENKEIHVLPRWALTSDMLKALDAPVVGKWCRVFDNMIIAHNDYCCSLIFKTSDGLVLIDAIIPGEVHFNNICKAIAEAGWDPNDIKAFIITHGHGDHTGCGKLIIDHFHPQVYMSKVDYEYWRNNTSSRHAPDFELDESSFVDDGDVIKVGDMEIKVYATPGHTPGGLSFIFPVYDQGIEYTAGMWGGTAVSPNIETAITYLKSLDYFMEECEKEGVETLLTNHPYIEHGVQRMEVCRNRYDHEPNPFIMGWKQCKQFADRLYRAWAYDSLMKCDPKAPAGNHAEPPAPPPVK